MNRTYRVRISLASIFTLLVLLIVIQPSHSQIRPGPGGIRGGTPPGPIGPPGAGISGIRGGVIGSPSTPGMPSPPGAGISGGFSGVGGRPPGFPDIPTPPRIGGRPGIGGPDIYDWSCSGCGRHLGTGTTPPLTRICPGCGARLQGSQIVDGPGAPRGGVVPPTLPRNPPITAPGPNAPPPGPVFNGGVYVPPSNNPPTTSSDSPVGRSRAMVLLITLGALLLLGVGIGAIVFTIIKSAQSSKPQRRPRPRSRSRYDDDDDY